MPEFLRANGRVQHYRLREGAGGRGIVFANSLGTDMRIWDDVIARLPADGPVLTWDKSGHGLSEAGATSIEELAEDLAALMDALSLREALVCGVSVGGMIAQALAAARPDLVAGLVLCNTGHRIGTRDNWAERIATLDASGLDAMAENVLERWFSPTFRAERPDALAGYRAMLTRMPRAGYRAVCAAIRDADLTERTRELRCPTLCVAGEADMATPPELVEALAALIPGADYTCLTGVGHLPCIEDPARLAKLVSARLARG
ncbi:3-oxoadipate enol-lactonase [Roseobacter sp. HKCCA0434]|uniref:3-oxoadipate enol-lactonase n=1 Tax=Roseobacter sp. HKCCA0434 TaxID=3079297 RepID=UPI002905D053|nr:3-oxoadipate enol-lactonase [Roseobacter sp. HKCCA0434]